MPIEILPTGVADPGAASPAPSAADRAAYRHCLEIRHVVFVEGQSVPEEIEFDGLDGEALHFIAYDDARRAIGTARMRVVDGAAKAERIAVLEPARGTGVGRALVEAIEARARREGLRRVRLNAQVQASAFYEKQGYRPHGAVFVEAGIDHRAMEKALD